MTTLKLFGIALVLTGSALYSEEKKTLGIWKKKPKKDECMVIEPIQEIAEPVEYCCCPPYYYENHRIRVGGNYTYAQIRPQGNSSTSGNLYGAQASYEYWPENSVYAGAFFNWRQGNTTGGGSKRYLRDFDTQARVGYSLPFAHNISKLAIYTGFAGRYMPEEVSSGSVTVDFDYVQFYVPLGFTLEYEVCSWLYWGLNFQWKPQIMPTVDISPLDGARWILTRTVNNISIDMPISYIWDSFWITLDPFFELWHDGKTTAKTLTNLSLGLPGNRYYFAGVNVNLGWNF